VVAVGLAGDYNHNGTVDAADYVVWRETDGTQAGYDLWRAHFGETSGVGAVSRAASTHFVGAPPPRLGEPTAVIPEPTSLALLILATVVGMARRSRTKHSY
jgi:hypothetical protein